LIQVLLGGTPMRGMHVCAHKDPSARWPLPF